jgi:3-isopropylmalate/(R)-2-methylmalate dehydratase small subunit
MRDNGYRAFIAPSFGDIFFNNCFQNGCLPIRLPAERVARLRVILHELPGAELSIDLASQTVLGPDKQADSFEIDSFRKEMLLKGTDSIDFTLGYEADIKRFEDGQRGDMPWL